MDTLNPDILKNHIHLYLPVVNNRISLALTSQSQLALFYKITLKFDSTNAQMVSAAQAAEALGLVWQSILFIQFPQCQPDYCVPRSLKGMAYLNTLGIGYNMAQKIKRGELTIKFTQEIQDEIKWRFEKQRSNYRISENFFAACNMNISGFKKYVLDEQLKPTDATVYDRQTLNALDDPQLQLYIDTGKITARQFCVLGKVFLPAILFILGKDDTKLMAQIYAAYTCMQDQPVGLKKEQKSSLATILANDWMYDQLKSEKITLDNVFEAPVYRIHSMPEGYREIYNHINDDHWDAEPLWIGIFEFKPIQLALDNKTITTENALSMDWKELNRLVPHFYQ